MFTTYHSNSLNSLQSLVSIIMQNNKLSNPLKAEIILVQNFDIAKWLKISLSKKLGICANIKFLMLDDFILNIFLLKHPNIPKHCILNKQLIFWKLISVIPNIYLDNKFKFLNNYLKDDFNKKKLFQLASFMADLYDQYSIYRPEWLLSWDKGKLIKNLPKSQIWQMYLWHILMKYNKKSGQYYWHRAKLCKYFISSFKSDSKFKTELPSRIFLFGIFSLPKSYLKILEILSNYIDIHILFNNPSRSLLRNTKKGIEINYHYKFISSNMSIIKNNYRFEQKNNENLCNIKKIKKISYNQLLNSWGKTGIDYILMLSKIKTLINVDAFTEKQKNINLLSNIQNDLLEITNISSVENDVYQLNINNRRRLLNINDRSITINVCHSIQREVEVLYDRLLAILEEDNQIVPSDIIVMVNNLDKYSSIFQSIFNKANNSYCLTYKVLNQNESQFVISQAFIKLLYLPESRFLVKDIFSLLEVPSIASNFNIDEEEINYLRCWIKESGIHWGMDFNSIKELKLPLIKHCTWNFGLKRIFLGHAMDSNLGEWNGIIPYGQSNSYTAKLISHLAFLLTKLNYWRHQLIIDKTLKEWLPLCKKIFSDFFHTDKESEVIFKFINSKWYNIIECGLNAKYNETISISIIRDELINNLNDKNNNKQFLTGSINICNLIPINFMPFKVVCLLGMNEKVYPRNIIPVEYNLMNYEQRIGDRDFRNEDRYLFLKLLISVQQKLYISYIGFSSHDNSKLLPSVIIQELLDYIGKNYYLPGDETLDVNHSEQKVKSHITFFNSMMPFDSINYVISEQQSFIKEWLPTARKKKLINFNFIKRLTSLPLNEININQLKQFWVHPIRAFFQMRLKINFKMQSIKIDDNEPFILNRFDKYQINKNLLTAMIKNKNLEMLFRYYRGSGQLPYGSYGKIVWEEQVMEMKLIFERILKYKKPMTNLNVSINFNGINLHGLLDNVQSDGLLNWSCSKLTMSQIMKFWLEHLIYSASGGYGESRFIAYKGSELCFLPISKKQAIFWLKKYILGYKKGINKPILLLLESGGSWIKTCYNVKKDILILDNITLQRARFNFLQIYEGNSIIKGESKDIWYQRLFRQLEPKCFSSIIKASKEYLLPIFRFKKY